MPIHYQLTTVTTIENTPVNDSDTLNEMIKLYDKALAISRNDTIVLSNKAIVLYNLAKYSEAIEICNKVLETDPDNVGCLYYKGLALDKIGSYEEADKSKRRAHEVDPTYGGELINKGPVSVLLRSAI
jgi:tetratricopeptide (TPR) repeat protein